MSVFVYTWCQAVPKPSPRQWSYISTDRGVQISAAFDIFPSLFVSVRPGVRKVEDKASEYGSKAR